MSASYIKETTITDEMTYQQDDSCQLNDLLVKWCIISLARGQMYYLASKKTWVIFCII